MTMEIMDLEATFGVVPTQDDLEWVWENLEDGVLLQDLLLSSVHPFPQKSSAVFVEPNYAINVNFNYNINSSGFNGNNNVNVNVDDDNMNNEWYTNNVEYDFIPKSMESQQQQSSNSLSMPPSNVMAQNYSDDFSNYYYYQSPEPKSDQMPMDFINMEAMPTVAAATLNNIPLHPEFLDETEINAFLNSNEPALPTTNNSTSEVFDQNNYRSAATSVHSNSSWDSFVDDEDASYSPELSQEEIFEEIQRECAEIERRSSSPSSSKKTIHKKKQSRGSRQKLKMNADERKKLLNRVAATKYREKRRIEKEQKLVELEKLESRNRKLRTQANGLEGEIKYLKDLIKEIRTRRGEEGSF